MSHWTLEQVSALAPDASSIKAAQKLLSKSKWPNLGQSPAALWGECQGSGKKPYLTRIDLSEPAFKCSCPSRKFPCKHALALFTLFVQNEQDFSQVPPPDWVSEWLESRSARAETKAKKADAPIDEAAQAKRAAAREKKIAAGLSELEIWLQDLLRTGLVQLPSNPPRFFEATASRLVDAQAPGLARYVRDLGDVSFSGETWADDVLGKLGRLQLLVTLYQRQEALPATARADVRRALGWTDNQADLIKQEGLHDDWLVLAQYAEQEASLRLRRSWLWGKASGRTALILEFAHGKQAFAPNLVAGRILTGELVFFPSHYPLRAVLKDGAQVKDLDAKAVNALRQEAHFDEVLEAYANALTHNGWLEQLPVFVADLIPTEAEGVVSIIDSEGRTLPLAPEFRYGWQLLGLSGGHKLSVIGEWDGNALLPLSVWQNELTIFESVQ